jgi:hypothetical protein
MCSKTQASRSIRACSFGRTSVSRTGFKFSARGRIRATLETVAPMSARGLILIIGFKIATDFTHILNVASVAQLPGRFEIGINFSYSSAPPLSAYVGGIDFNGDGTTSDLLPGTTVNILNRGMGRADLQRLVAEFNASYAGTKDSQGAAIKQLTLPSHYGFGDNFQALDVRLSRGFVFRERWRLSLIGEVFNLYNHANLTGYSGDLSSAAFGQPTNRATQVFGSGGPRAFQLAVRFSF